MEVRVEAVKVELRFIMPKDWGMVLVHNKKFNKHNLYNGIMVSGCMTGPAAYNGVSSSLVMPLDSTHILLRDISPIAAKQIEKAMKEYMIAYNHISTHSGDDGTPRLNLIHDSAICKRETPLYSIETCKGGIDSNVIIAAIHKSVFEKADQNEFKTSREGITYIRISDGAPLLLFSMGTAEHSTKAIRINFTEISGDYHVGISSNVSDANERKIIVALVQFCESA